MQSPSTVEPVAAGTGNGNIKKKRARIPISCTECRKRKQKVSTSPTYTITPFWSSGKMVNDMGFSATKQRTALVAIVQGDTHL